MFEQYNHDQFELFPEVLKYHRKALMKEFKLYSQYQESQRETFYD